MIYRLIFLNGPRTGERITTSEHPLCFGSDPDCAVRVEDPEMALRHAEVFQKGDELFIRDLGTMNKILVNKREVQESRLKHGDEFELGRTRFVVQALVQAEVAGQRALRRRRQAAWAVTASLMLVLALALSARYVPRGPDAEIETSGLAPISADSAAAPRAAGPVPPALTEDLRLLREDLRAIQDKVKTLGATQAPPKLTSLPTLKPPRSPRTPREEAEELIGPARGAVKAGHHAEADRLLAHIQHIDPDFLPAYEVRADLFEKEGRTGDAAGQWSEILRRSIESPLYQRAVAERIRLSRVVPPGTDDAPALRITAVEHSRFPNSADYDEMRVLKIVLADEGKSARPNPDDIRIDVTFYDRDTETGDIEPTRGRVDLKDNDSSPTWGRTAERIHTATCLIPKGLRDEQRAGGSPRTYHGYHLRLYYRDQLLDEAAQPRQLLAAASTTNATRVALDATSSP
ncbi:MAG TPA: FHA domain-containing protein [Kiritimatiellia bacterium]|nr:FHA domain-containing protein [Kiritimatiellia bacterium]